MLTGRQIPLFCKQHVSSKDQIPRASLCGQQTGKETILLTETLKQANSLQMWLCCAPLVLLVLFQAWIFWRLGMKYKREFSITPQDVRTSLRSGIISTLGPALSVFAVGLGLMTGIGAPLTLSRLSVIGNSMYESFSAQYAASAVGTALGAADFSMKAFTCCIFAMNLGGIAMLILPLVFLRPVDMATNKAMKSGSGTLGKTLGISATLGSFGYTALNYFCNSKGTLLGEYHPKYVVSVLVGAGTMPVFSVLAKKKNVKWLREWSLAFAVILGAVATVFVG